MFAALIGPGQQENLALEYLAAAAQKSDHRTALIRFDSSLDLQFCIDEIRKLKPDLVGISIPFQYAIADSIELARALRLHGYQGHLTCGGQVPTFCYFPLLADAPEIDTAVRHEGEETFVEMLEALAAGEPLRDIAGLVWRENGKIAVGPTRALNTDLDAIPFPIRNPVPFTAGGVPLAFAISSRGCSGECAYCSIRAFSKDAGGPPFRLRSADATVEELASLYHIQGVRVVVLQDDLFVLPDEQKTIDRMEALGRGLLSRGVKKMLFWIKGRPETISRAVLEAARAMGVVHLFLGVENASVARLAYLGRRHTPADNERALLLCAGERITPSFNLMLFDPDCTWADIRTNLDFAGQHLDLTWNICRTEIYPGTRLFSRLQEQGRLLGDYRTLGYQIGDPVAELMFRILRIGFMQRSLAADSLHNQLITLSFVRQIHCELLPGPATDAYSERVDKLIRDVNRDTLEELRRIADFTRTADIGDLEGVRKFAVEAALDLNERGHKWLCAVQELSSILSARGSKIHIF